MDFKTFEDKAGLHFRDSGILKQAFTHRSYLNENRASGLEHNERLEFLGDAVLELVTTDYLYKRFPEMDEGQLTSLRSALVNWDSCAQAAEKLGMNEYLLLSKGESKDTGRARQYILANTMEALIGAIYMDQGFDAAKEFILNHITTLTDSIIAKGAWIDAKSSFQTQAQEHEGITPTYKTIRESGPDHDKHFTIGVYLNNDKVGEGEGKSKQDAEQEAAKSALKAKGWG